MSKIISVDKDEVLSIIKIIEDGISARYSNKLSHDYSFNKFKKALEKLDLLYDVGKDKGSD